MANSIFQTNLGVLPPVDPRFAQPNTLTQDQKPLVLTSSGRLPKIETPAQEARTDGKKTLKEFGQAIKQKYPEYSNIDDVELGRKTLEKYPEYADRVITDEQMSVAEPKKEGLLKSIGKGIYQGITRPLMTPVAGFVAGVTGKDVELPWYLGGAKGSNDPTKQAKIAGGAALEAASLLPLGRAVSTVGQLGKTSLGTLAVQGFKEGVFASGLGSMGQELSTNEDATLSSTLGQGAAGTAFGGTLGLVFPLAGAVVGKALGKNVSPIVKETTDALGQIIDRPQGNVFQKLGQGIQTRIIKPTAKDLKNGFSISNVNKYGVGGELEDGFNTTQKLLNENMTKINKMVQDGGDVPAVNLGEAVDNLRSKYKAKIVGVDINGKRIYESGKLGQIGGRKEIIKALDDLESELSSIMPDWRNKTLGFSDTIQTKRAVGNFTAFLHDPIKGNQVSPVEDVWNSFYHELKNASEKVASPLFQKLNKEVSELIPIQQAYIRRIPVAARNNQFGLNDILGGIGAFVHPGALAVPLMNKLLQSGKLAKYLMSLGGKEGLEKISKTSAAKTLGVATKAMKQTDINANVLSKTKDIIDPFVPQKARFETTQKTLSAPPAQKMLPPASAIYLPEKMPRFNKTIVKNLKKESGKSMFGGVAGLEPEFDENGKMKKIRFNTNKALIGVAGVALGKPIIQKIQKGAIDDLTMKELRSFKDKMDDALDKVKGSIKKLPDDPDLFVAEGEARRILEDTLGINTDKIDTKKLLNLIDRIDVKRSKEVASKFAGKGDDVLMKKMAGELQDMKNAAEILKLKAQKTNSGTDIRAWRKLQNEIEAKESNIRVNTKKSMSQEQRIKDEKIRLEDPTVDKLSEKDFDFLLNEVKKADNLDDFIDKVRGSATQYGEYNPKLRKYLRPESVFVGDIKGLNPNTKITVYRGIDSKSVAGKQIRNGDFVTTDYNDALGYTDSPSKVVSKEVRLKDLVEEYPDEIDITNPLKPISYELIYNSTGKINKITDSQLTDIWNKANKINR